MGDEHEIVMVNRAMQLALTRGGVACLFSTMLDEDGEQTEDSSEAVAVVVQVPDGRWAAVDLREFEPAVFN